MSEDTSVVGSGGLSAASQGKLKGKAFKFGDNISTDHIAPGRFFHLRSNLPELAKHVLEDADPTFASRVQAGDFVVAGSNFGLGSSREHAPTIIKLAGVGAVMAKSAARIFFRNAINVGLPVLICNTDLIEDGDELEVDLEAGTIFDVTRGVQLTAGRIPASMVKILTEGGLAAYVEKRGDLDFAD
jgi:3-isopropylmalate/(R)-2-methylmalate dehydratase small subunit